MKPCAVNPALETAFLAPASRAHACFHSVNAALQAPYASFKMNLMAPGSNSSTQNVIASSRLPWATQQGSHGYVGPSLMQKYQTNTNLNTKKDSFQNHVEGMELVASILSTSGSLI